MLRSGNWRGSLRWLMTRCRPFNMNGWRSSNGTKRTAGEALKKEGGGDTEHPIPVYASPTDHSKAEGTSHPFWIQHVKDIPLGGAGEPWDPARPSLLGDRRLWVTPSIHLVRRKPHFPMNRRGPRRDPTAEKSTECPGEFKKKKKTQALSWPKHNRPRKQSRSSRKPWNSWPRKGKQSRRDHCTQARSPKNKHIPPTETRALPVVESPRDYVATNWAQWHSKKSTGTRRPQSSLFTNYPSRGSSGTMTRAWGQI